MTSSSPLSAEGNGYWRILALIYGGTLLFFLLLGMYEWRQISRNTESLAMERGRMLFTLIELTRDWNALHGGVYVPVTPETPPNPHLQDDPTRDVPGSDGHQLTKINPAYMTRQIAEVAEKASGVRLHLTSLSPVRPGNRADEWETRTLQRFERDGETREYIEFVERHDFGDKALPAHRYMAPLRVKPHCMKCHEQQGYKVGDIQGGISVTMPAGDLLSVLEARRMDNLLLIFTGFVLTATLLHVLAARARRHYRELRELADRQEAIIAERTRELEERNDDLHREVAERRRREGEFRHKAHHDALTDLPNRVLFYDRLQAAFSHARRYKRIFALLQIDLDHFKEVNDTLGHAAGDELLIEASRRLVSCVRESDTVARLGGDEFTIILSEMEREAEAEQVARRAVELLGEPYHLDAGTVRISGCVGIALYPRHGQDGDELQRNADSALYAAKAGGRNTYQIYSPAESSDRPQGDLL